MSGGAADVLDRWRQQGRQAWRFADVVLVRTADGEIEWAHGSVSTLCGEEAAALAGRGLVELIQSEDVPAWRRCEETLAHGGYGAFRGRLVAADGGERWVEMRGRLSTGSGDDGRRHVLWSCRDVTTEVTTREELRQSRDAFRLIAENASDVVGRIGAGGLIEWVSPSVTAMSGWEPDELVGTAFAALIHPEDAAGLLAEKDRLSAGDGPVSVEVRVRTKAGGWVWAGVMGRAVRDGQGTMIGRVGSWRHIGREVAARQRVVETTAALAASEARYRLLAENVSDVVTHVRDGILAWVSPSMATTFGWQPGELVGRPSSDYVHPDDLNTLLTFRTRLQSGDAGCVRLRARASDGVYHWIEITGRDYRDEAGQLDGVITSWRVVDDRIAAERELARRAQRDELTGLYNRREAITRLEDMLARVAAGVRPGLSVLFCDIDDFKAVNDRLGHHVGDEVIRVVARRLAAEVRHDDLVARLGGDEFIVALADVDELPIASRVAEKIRSAVQHPINIDGNDAACTLSIGLTLAEPSETVDRLLARADHAMYLAKRAGRNRVSIVER